MLKALLRGHLEKMISTWFARKIVSRSNIISHYLASIYDFNKYSSWTDRTVRTRKCHYSERLDPIIREAYRLCLSQCIEAVEIGMSVIFDASAKRQRFLLQNGN